jgi:hypothetical protein
MEAHAQLNLEKGTNRTRALVWVDQIFWRNA